MAAAGQVGRRAAGTAELAEAMRHLLIFVGAYRHSGFAGASNLLPQTSYEKLRPDAALRDAQYLPSAVSGRQRRQALSAVPVETGRSKARRFVHPEVAGPDAGRVLSHWIRVLKR